MPPAPPRRHARWPPRSLQAQFTLGLVGLVLLCVAGAAVAVGALRRSADATRRLAGERLARLEEAQELVRLTTLIDRDGDALVLAAGAPALHAAQREVSRHLDALDALVERLGGSSASVAVLDLHASGQAVRNSAHVVAQLREQLLGAAAPGPGEGDLREFHAELSRQAGALIAAAQSLSADSTRQYRAAVQALVDGAARDQALVFALLVASVVTAVLVARVFLGHRVLRRLQQVSQQLRQEDPGAAESPHLPIAGDDEIAEMARAVEQFLDDRRRLAEAEREAERRRADEALRASEAELARAARILSMGAMAASVAHEVNQPLTSIVLHGKACLRWLSGEVPDLREARESVGHIVDDATRAAEVISRIRALTANRQAERGPVAVNDIVEQVLLLARAELKRGGVIVRTALGAELPLVIADRIQLQQVVLNLVMNAAEAMRDVTGRARELVVETTAHDRRQLVVAVRDTGVGLDADARARIFEAFYTTKSGGIGLGLSISRSIVESHGGRLWVGPNAAHGATFRFTLPCVPA